MPARQFTEDELRAAWQSRRRANWPETFEEAMNDRCFHGLIRVQARIDQNKTKATAKAPRRTSKTLIHIPHHPVVMDAKRLAAGERDDDFDLNPT